MAITSFLFGGSPTLTEIGALSVDAAISIVAGRNARATKFPVEKGSEGSDHVILEPINLTIQGIISNSPLSTVKSLASGLGATALAGQFQGLAPGGQGSGLATSAVTAGAAFGIGTAAGAIKGLIEDRKTDDGLNPDDPDYPKLAWDFLLKTQSDRKPFTIVTGLKTYENMVLTRLNATSSVEVGESLSFDATAEEITIVETQNVKLTESEIAADAAASAASKSDLGKQAAEQANSEESGNASILFKLFG